MSAARVSVCSESGTLVLGERAENNIDSVAHRRAPGEFLVEIAEGKKLAKDVPAKLVNQECMRTPIVQPIQVLCKP